MHLKGFDGFIYHLLNVLGCSDAKDTFIPAPDYLYPIKQRQLINQSPESLDKLPPTRIFINSDDRRGTDMYIHYPHNCWFERSAEYSTVFLLNGPIGDW